MKKVILSLATFVCVIFISCEKDIIEPDAVVQKDIANRTTESIISDIHGISINSGAPSNCANNILVFPSWESYYQTIEQLDNMVEESIDAYDASIGADQLNDEQYDAQCEIDGFDENNVLIDFENEKAFCSLRKKIAAEEINWLDQQGDGEWNMNNDPDNHFIDDETERTLLNEQVQVAIRDRKGIVIYQFNNDSGNYTAVYNLDMGALQQINAGTIPTNNPNVVNVIVRPPLPFQILCKDDVTRVKNHYVGDERLKQTSKIRREVLGLKADSKIKAKTKGYKKKRNGKWAGARRLISVGICGQTFNTPGIAYNQCLNVYNDINQPKERRKRTVKAKVTIPYHDGTLTQVLQYLTVRDNELYSHHKRGAVIVIDDFYDM